MSLFDYNGIQGPDNGGHRRYLVLAGLGSLGVQSSPHCEWRGHGSEDDQRQQYQHQ